MKMKRNERENTLILSFVRERTFWSRIKSIKTTECFLSMFFLLDQSPTGDGPLDRSYCCCASGICPPTSREVDYEDDINDADLVSHYPPCPICLPCLP